MRHLTLAFALVLLAGCGSPSPSPATGEAKASMPKIGLIQYASTKSLDDLRDGFLRGLDEGGYKSGSQVEIIQRNAEADAGTLSLAMKQFKDQGVSLVGVISTQALQAGMSALDATPIVFCGVMDPVAAGVGPNIEAKKDNVTGVQNPFPVEEGIAMIVELDPKAKVVGSLYDPSEAFSEKLLERAEAACQKHGLKWVAISVSNASEIVSGTQALAARGVQAVLQLPGNTVNQGTAGQVQQCQQLKIPMFSLQPDQIPTGVVAAVGLDLKSAGERAGKMAAEVLNGKSPKDLPIEGAEVQPMVWNDVELKRFGLEVPPR